MDRLTIKNSMGEYVLKSPVVCDRCREQDYDPITESGESVATCLGRYEDLGLPAEKLRYTAETAFWIHKKGLERTLELANADSKGLCVVLPFDAGTKLYVLQGVGIAEHTVRRFTFQRTQCNPNMELYIHTDLGMIYAGNVGKTAFLTHEDAEQALGTDQ